MHAEVITIGSEILTGQTAESNFRVIAGGFALHGIPIARHTVLPDEREALGAELGAALRRSPVVVTTGGLGATPDDVTRRVMASVLGRKLIFRENLLVDLRARLAERGRTLGPELEAMALVPAGAQPLPNPVGLAPGLLLRTQDSLLFALPGVPEEMEAMLAGSVLPYLHEQGLAGDWVVETLRTVGIPETKLVPIVTPLIGKGIGVSYLPSAGRVDLRLSTSGGEKGRQEISTALKQLSDRLGPAVYAHGGVTLEETIVSLLRRSERTLAVAESLTGGRVGAAITSVPGSSHVFRGGIAAYGDEAKQRLLGVSERTLAMHGAVSPPIAREMSEGARRVLQADVAISTTGIAGPSGGSAEKPVGLVCFGYSDARVSHSYAFRFGGNRSMIQEYSVTMALNLLRLALIGRLDVVAAHVREPSSPSV